MASSSSRGFREWSQFEKRALYSLMVKDLHNVNFDPTKSKSRHRYMDLATALNRAINKDDISSDIPLREITRKIESILTENKGAIAFLEANRSFHLTRRMFQRFERKLNFTGSVQEWEEGRKDEEAAKPRPFFDESQADVLYTIERDDWECRTKKLVNADNEPVASGPWEESNTHSDDNEQVVGVWGGGVPISKSDEVSGWGDVGSTATTNGPGLAESGWGNVGSATTINGSDLAETEFSQSHLGIKTLLPPTGEAAIPIRDAKPATTTDGDDSSFKSFDGNHLTVAQADSEAAMIWESSDVPSGGEAISGSLSTTANTGLEAGVSSAPEHITRNLDANVSGGNSGSENPWDGSSSAVWTINTPSTSIVDRKDTQRLDLFPHVTSAVPRSGFMANRSGMNPDRLQRLERRSASPQLEIFEDSSSRRVPAFTFSDANADPLPYNRFEQRGFGSGSVSRSTTLNPAPIYSVGNLWLTDGNKENEEPTTIVEWGDGAVDTHMRDTDATVESDGWDLD